MYSKRRRQEDDAPTALEGVLERAQSVALRIDQFARHLDRKLGENNDEHEEDEDEDEDDDDKQDENSNELGNTAPGPWSISRRRRNYCTIGLNLRDTLPDHIFIDPILAIVLDYCGSTSVYVLSWSKTESTNHHDYREAEHEIVGVYQTRTLAACAALEQMDYSTALQLYRKKGKSKSIKMIHALRTSDDQEEFIRRLSPDDQELVFDELMDSVSDRRGTMHAPEPYYEIDSFCL